MAKKRTTKTPEQMAARNAVGRIRKAACALADLGDEERLLKAAAVLNEIMLALHKKKTL